MKGLLFVLALIAAVTISERCSATEKTWALTGAFRLPVVGPLNEPKRLTGSVLPTLQLGWHPPGANAVTVGVEGAYGLDQPRWSIILGGLFAEIARQPFDVPLRFSAALALLGGRMPVINGWGLAINYSGLYPRAGLGATWTPRPELSLGLGCDGYWVRTLGWSGLAPSPTVHVDGRF